MNLDPHTLLVTLLLINVLIMLSLYSAAYTQGAQRDGIGKWTLALSLETIVWMLFSVRGHIPEFLLVLVGNGLISASQSLKLAAIFEFQQRRLPRWMYLLPLTLILLMICMLSDDASGRFIWGGPIFGLQMVLFARALWVDRDARAGRAWHLLFGQIVLLLLVLMARSGVALADYDQFNKLHNATALQPVQMIAFVAVLAATLLGSIGFVLMIKERTDREIRHLAMTDSLTLIPNRRALIDRVEQALARRNGTSVTLLMIDVDHFKLINDTLGHYAGDEILRKIAIRLSERLRGEDMPGRYGGEEFCVVAPDTGREGALQLAESIRKSIATIPFDTGKGSISVTVSIGIALCSINATRELKEVFAEADTALYMAKQTGRNRVVCFQYT